MYKRQKKRRLNEVIELHRIHALESMQKDIGKTFKILVEGPSKKNENELMGRASNNKVVIFAKGAFKKGDYVDVLIERCTSAALFGTPVDIKN